MTERPQVRKRSLAADTTSCPALCHAVIRARQQISKDRGPSMPSVAPCSGWSRPSRLRRWAPASLDHPARGAPRMGSRDGETARLCQTEKLLVDHISCLRALGLGAAVIDVLYGEIELPRLFDESRLDLSRGQLILPRSRYRSRNQLGRVMWFTLGKIFLARIRRIP